MSDETERTVAEPGAAPKEGRIHDLGYQRYTGPRLPARRRFLVISRSLVALAWRSRWGVKLPLILAGLLTVGAMVAMFVMRHDLASQLRSRGVPLPTAEAIIFYVHPAYLFAGFLLSAVVACGAVADDLRAGAFAFYFSRPLRTGDYLLGKLLGLAIVVGLGAAAGPILLGLFRLLLAAGSGDLVAALAVLPRVLALGLTLALLVSFPAVALGALIGRRGPAQAAFVAAYLVLNGLGQGLAHALKVPALALIGLQNNAEVIASALFGVDPRGPHRAHPPAWAAVVVSLGIVAASALVTYLRVRRAETTGPGGGS